MDAPFAQPTLLFDNASVHRTSGRFWRDEKTLYYSEEGYKTFVATRSSASVSFKRGSPVVIDDSPGGLTPFLTRDGLSLYVDRNDGVLSVASRNTLEEPFDSYSTVNNLLPYPRAPYFVNGDRVLYYSAYADASLSTRNVYRTELTANGFSASEIILRSEGASWQDNVAVTQDELTIYFDKVGVMYVATRSNVREPFSNIRKVEELDSPEQREYPTWISDDGCRILFDSVYQNDGPQSTIYFATKPLN